MIGRSISKFLALAAFLVTAWMALLIILRYPDNHGGGAMMFRWVFLGILIAVGICVIWRSKFAIIAVVLASFGLLSTWIVDHRNILVSYDVWMKRGMPAWGEVSP